MEVDPDIKKITEQFLTFVEGLKELFHNNKLIPLEFAWAIIILVIDNGKLLEGKLAGQGSLDHEIDQVPLGRDILTWMFLVDVNVDNSKCLFKSIHPRRQYMDVMKT